MRVRPSRLVLAFLMSSAGAVLTSPAAFAHPAGAHDRVVAAEPAVVYIETSVTAQVVLHDMGKPVFLQLKTFDEPPLMTGSGIVVNQTGTVVTAASLVSPPLDRARVYAANKMFSTYYKVSVPGDPFAKHQLSDPTLNTNLQNCYDTQELYMKGATCVVSMTTRVRVFPFVTKPTPDGLPAEVLRAGQGADGVAVLAINSSNTPTVALAPALGRTEPVSTIGFTDPPTATSHPVTADEHLKPPGATRFTAADLAMLRNEMGTQTTGVPVISGQTGSLVALVSGAGDGTLIPVERVTDALRALGIRPSRSVVDSAFADAAAFYSDQHFTHAVPRLQEVLQLDPQNAMASQMLQVALAKRGTAADKSNQDMGTMPMGGASPGIVARPSAALGGSGHGVSGWLIALYAALGVLALAVLAAFAFGRRLTSGGSILGWRPRRPAPGTSSAASAAAFPASPAGGGRGDREPRPSGSAPGRPPQPPQPRREDETSSRNAQHTRVSAAAPEEARQVGTRGAEAASGMARSASATSAGTIAPRRFCTDCGGNLAPHHRYCGSCGTAVH